VNSALLIAGDSSIYALGAPSGKDFWKISIHNPYNSEGSLGDLLLRDEALSTSACYGGVVEDADDVCDILDPTTGNAVSGMMSATVVAPSGMQTDALSTAFFVMGVDGAAQYCKSHENVKAVLFEIPKNDVPSPHYIGRWSTKQKKEV